MKAMKADRQFNLMFKTVTPDHALKETLELPEEGDKENERLQDQSNYNEVADGVVAFVQQQLTTLCDLLPYPLPTTAADANSVVYATSNFQDGWAGAMFDYIFRAQTLGWAVVVANPNVNDICGKSITGSESPHRHLMTLWKSYLDTAKASKILVVAHSYGAPNLVNLLKVEASARERLAAVAFTDGGAFPPGVLLEERVPSEADVAKAAKPEQMGFLRQTLLRFEQLAPEAFRLATPEVAQCLERVGRNFRADGRAPGTPLAAWSEGVHRLQNRVLLLQRELELLRGPRGRGAHLEPMVPEKQFQQLTTAHAKVATQLQVLKEQRKAQRYGMGHEVNHEFGFHS
eukprot:s8_g25.t1